LSYASIMGLQTDLKLQGDNYQWLGSMFYFVRITNAVGIDGFSLTLLSFRVILLGNIQQTDSYSASP
jgi:hypothetical protein